LKLAIELRDLVTTGFWPEITVRSATQPSMSDGWPAARPTPMLMTIFSRFGTCITFSMPRSFCSCALISSLYRAFRRGISVSTAVLIR
jgi:hypothetical protein